ncbi:hypothetical protein FACS189454_04470 [Planctomycetales bacterium]|nr:hypothetical protein FACS189454_04470 [Planctomycetales bacterium]
MKHLFLLFALLPLLVNACIAADKAPLTLETAKTEQEIQRLVQQNTKRTNTELQALAEKHGEVPTADLITLLTQNGNFQVSAGDKLLNIGRQSWEKEQGYQTMIAGLQVLAQSEHIAAVEKLATQRNFTEKDKRNGQKMQPLITEVEKTEMPSAKRLREILSEVEKDGHYNNFVGNYLINKFVQDGYKSAGEKFSQERFDAYLNEAKQLINRNLESLPAERILQRTQQIAKSWQFRSQMPQNDSVMRRIGSWLSGSDSGKQAEVRQLDKEARKVLVDFINSKQCALPADKKKAALDSIQAVLQREVGGELKLYGKLLDGKDLDWNGLLAKNKYVLVEFTATWCGPCRAELPNLKKAFDKYHDKGFDVVQVYVWEHGGDPVGAVKELVEKEKLQWTVVSEHLTKQEDKDGKNQAKPQSEYFGIDGVPTLLLLDKTGKVVATDNLRDTALQKKLAELLGK